MALTKCEECGKVSAETSKCPHCGSPALKAVSPAHKLARNAPIFWGLFIILGGALMAWGSGDESTRRILLYGTIGTVLLVAVILVSRSVDARDKKNKTDED